MIADQSVLATWREDDQFDPVALIRRGLRLAKQLELYPTRMRQRQAPDPTSPATIAQRAPRTARIPQPPVRRPGVTTQAQGSGFSQHAAATVEDRFALDWAQLWCQRGEHKLQQQDYGGAQHNFAKALEKWPQMAAAHNGLGMVFYHYRDFNSAIAAFRQALQYEPQAGHVFLNLGSTLYRLGDLTGAIAHYREALQGDTKQVAAYYGLGVSFFRLGRYSEALTAYEQAILRQPHQAHCYAGLGRLLFDLGDIKGAIAAYRRATQLNPDFVNVYLQLQLQAVPTP